MTQKKTGSPFWRKDMFVGLAALLITLLLYAATDLISGMERRFYDGVSTLTSREPNDRIAVIAIDDQSIANMGRWPWPRDLHARLIDRLHEAGAKTVAHTAFFFEPQTDRGLDKLRTLQQQLQALPDSSEDALRKQVLNFIEQAASELDADADLARSLKTSGQVLLPSVYQIGEPVGRPDTPLPPYAAASALTGVPGVGLPAVAMQQPLPRFGELAAGIGHLNQWPDIDGVVRQEALFVDYDGQAVPSLALLIAAHSLNLRREDIRLVPGEAVELGRLRIPTDTTGLTRPQFYPSRQGRAPFAVDSFYDVMSGRIQASKYAGKIVLIGGTAAGIGANFTTPVASTMSPVETLAHVTSSLLSGHFIAQPAWSGGAVLVALLLVTAYLLWALPRLSAGRAAALSASLFVALLLIEFGLLSGAATWVPLVLPAFLLLLGHLLLTTRRFLVTEVGKAQSDQESAETNRMMGLALQGQGQLDMALDRFQRVPYSPALMDNLKQLALDFERKRQFNKVQSVYEHMARLDPKDPDIQARLQRVRTLSETVVLGGSGGHPGGSLVLGHGQVEKPMLGRYQIEKELGKGAMGVVYQGKDPKIGRTVAIKTLALSTEFEGEELNDARERFFREAETAGRLQHPHIVTIFDAGEEHDLAYIAMEFLRGRDLVDQTRSGQLLPISTVLGIGERVAMALDYAHAQHVVHRDIKPGNIMYDAATDTVKVTDFGIARITDSSKTKTGMVLGTPSFMSPEQLAGQRVDGRSDLYSLGVTLFQLLTGTLPFRADSMAALMYQIANEPPPDPRQHRPELPAAVAAVLMRSMAKKASERYATGAELAADLRRAAQAPVTETTGGNDPSWPALKPSHAPPHDTQTATARTVPMVETHVMDSTVPLDPTSNMLVNADLAARFETTQVLPPSHTLAAAPRFDTTVIEAPDNHRPPGEPR